MSSSSLWISTLEKRDAFFTSVLKKHDVFISFRGEDTRNNFTSHLLVALRRYGIDTFSDEKTLERGDEIKQALRVAIQRSTIFIIVFSRNYAFSSWCLDELRCIHEYNKESKKIVIPIFYHVDPSDVRRQHGTYAEAFQKHEKLKDKEDMVRRWKDALTEFGNLAGFHLNGTRPESTLVEEIAQDVLEKLNHQSSSDDSDGLIGIEEHIENIRHLLCINSQNVRIIGIWGMGGLGKTTIAEHVFHRFSCQFESCCFLKIGREKPDKHGQLLDLRNELLHDLLGGNINSRTTTLSTLVKERLCRKKVLIVLDDVNYLEQLNFFIGDRNWFHCESRIIITTRDAIVLNHIQADEIYKVEELKYDEALRLFQLKAFKGRSPSTDHIKLSNEVVKYAGGIPLVIEILGSQFHSHNFESTRDWEMILNYLKEVSRDDVMKMLKISYDCGLDEKEKAIFLDLACFFEGQHRDYVENILNGCDFSATIRIKTLLDKSLIKINHNKIWMHDLVQEMGWEIVHQESEKLGERSRLWIAEEACSVLNNNEGTGKIEGIFLNISNEELHLRPEVFQNMHQLRLLKISRTYCDTRIRVYLCQDLQSLPARLTYLHWETCPIRHFPLKFKPCNLVELHMPYSEIEQLWDGVQNLNKLKIVDLSYSFNLNKIPNLSCAPNLERINLQCCTNLFQIPWHSWKNLGKLVILNLNYCEKIFPDLQILPDGLAHLLWERCPLNSFPLKFKSCNLVELHMPYSQLEKLWDGVQDLSRLKSIDLRHSVHLTKIPDLSHAPNLERINLQYCTNLLHFPWHSLQNLDYLFYLALSYCEKLCNRTGRVDGRRLRYLDLQGCFNINTLSMISTPRLTYLDLSSTAIEHLPSSIDSLNNLSRLLLNDCKWLRNIPSRIHKLDSLKNVVLRGCSSLHIFPKLPRNIEYIDLSKTAIKEVSSSSFENCVSLHSILMYDCKRLESLPANIFKLRSSRYYLRLDRCSNLKNLPEISEFSQSSCELFISGTGLRQLPTWIGNIIDRATLCLSGCKNLKYVSDNICNISSLRELDLSNCSKLEHLPPTIGNFLALTHLDLEDSNILEIPLDIKRLSTLVVLKINNCKKIQYLPELPLSLRVLEASGCMSLEMVSAPNRTLIKDFLNDFPIYSVVSAPNRSLIQEFQIAFPLYSVFYDCLRVNEKGRNNIITEFQFRVLRAKTIPVFRETADSYPCVGTCFPGDEIPEWFNYQYGGSSIGIRLPPQWHNPNFLGFAVSVVATDSYSDNKYLQLCCNFNLKPSYGQSFEWHFHHNHESLGEIPTFDWDHVFMWYSSSNYSCCLDAVEARFNFCFKEYGEDLQVRTESLGKIKRCGIRILYWQDVLKTAIADQPEPSAPTTTVFDTEAPHPKRIKRSNSL